MENLKYDIHYVSEIKSAWVINDNGKLRHLEITYFDKKGRVLDKEHIMPVPTYADRKLKHTVGDAFVKIVNEPQGESSYAMEQT